jgi:predicted  nucleic acid-binding Zn-ribbon protein
MSLVGKIFAVIAMIAAVFYAGITATLVSLQENYKQKLVDAEAAHDRTVKKMQNDFDDLDARHKQLQGVHDRLKKEEQRLTGQNRELRAEWEIAATTNRVAMGIIKDQEGQIEGLNAQVDRYRDDLLAKQKDNDKLNDTIKDLNTKLTDMRRDRDKQRDLLTVREKDLTNAMKALENVTEDLSRHKDLVAKLRDQRPDIYSDLIKGDILPPEKIIRGKVTGVDKSLGLVIINVGQRHEVRKGYSFIVFRGDQYIGKIMVDEVFPDMAAGHYIREAMKKNEKTGALIGVEVGDDVTTKLTIEL